MKYISMLLVLELFIYKDNMKNKNNCKTVLGFKILNVYFIFIFYCTSDLKASAYRL